MTVLGGQHTPFFADYEAGMIANPVYEPYFQWKLYGANLSSLTQSTLQEMAEKTAKEMEELDAKHPEAYKGLTQVVTLEDIWRPYALYGEDKYLYAYLSAIDNEVVNLRQMMV